MHEYMNTVVYMYQGTRRYTSAGYLHIICTSVPGCPVYIWRLPVLSYILPGILYVPVHIYTSCSVFCFVFGGMMISLVFMRILLFGTVCLLLSVLLILNKFQKPVTYCTMRILSLVCYHCPIIRLLI